MRRARKSSFFTVIALPLLVMAMACSATERGAQAVGPKPTPTTGKPERLPTADELRIALLTESEAPDFRITLSEAVDDLASQSADYTGVITPATCTPLRYPIKLGPGATAAARSTLYKGSSSLDLRETLLAAYPAESARARMSSLRKTLDTCQQYKDRNPYGRSSVKVTEMKAPDLGDEVIRFLTTTTSTLASGKSFSYELATVIRTGGIITGHRTHVMVGGGIQPDKRAALIPVPDEPLIAAQVKKSMKIAISS